jgi:hypothetical protein
MSQDEAEFTHEMTLLGLALYQAQRIEFALYGIASHVTHLPEFQSNRRFRDLNPEAFLRGDLSKLKATLGQLNDVFAGRLLLSSPELDRFISDRNLIAHNFFRIFHTKTRDEPEGEPVEFLKDFLRRSQELQSVIEGSTATLKEETAKKFGRLSDIQITDRDNLNKDAYCRYVMRHKLGIQE